MNEQTQPQSSIIRYQTEDGHTRIQCRIGWTTIGSRTDPEKGSPIDVFLDRRPAHGPVRTR